MLITEVRVRPVHSVGRIRALASITLGDELVIHDLRIVEGSKGLFVSMPSRRNPGGDYYDVAHPITAEARNILQATVLGAYEHAGDEKVSVLRVGAKGDAVPQMVEKEAEVPKSAEEEALLSNAEDEETLVSHAEEGEAAVSND